MKMRFFIYGAILALLPFFASCYLFLNKRQEWQRIETEIQKMQLLHNSKKSRQVINDLVRKEFKQTAPYLFTDLAGLSFLKKERDALNRLFASRSFTGNEAAERRYAFITGGENRLQFVESSGQDCEGVLECEVALLHPIEVDTSDIKALLNVMEGRKTGPQLFFTDWRLTRKETGLGSEVYTLNLKLLKREYHDE